MMQIGQSQHETLASLRQTLTDLKAASTGEFVTAFERQITRIDGWVARIAAIGQVKAGKSSTLNALIGNIDFLPSDVNPWTTVVTNMRINIPGDPKAGARFEFFNEKSWDRIINGDPNVRAAAQKHLPGFDPELLREQTEEMRTLAARRLGPSYVKLLGSHHDYDLLSAELLQSYVCAGPSIEDATEEMSVGRYSSITRVANLFMQSKDYAVPSIVTDTPGVNDPFLVRDEFTCQSLDQSDIFLVMLSAHQALTEIDIALVRMLSMQEEKEVIVYINRIDELEDAPRRVPKIVEDVTARLREAIPDSRFTVEFGSARWAELALDADKADAEIRKVLRISNVEEFLSMHRSETPSSPREKLLIASGLPAIKAALSRAIDDGTGARFVSSVSTETNVQIAAMKSLSRRQRFELQDQIESYGSGKVAEFREGLEDEMTILAETHTALAELIEDSDEDLDARINASWVALQQSMTAVTARFVEAQRRNIERRLSGTAPRASAQVDLLPLREALEECLRSSYARARHEMDIALDDALGRALGLAMRTTEGLENEIGMDGLPGKSVAVTFATSNKTLSFDLVSRRSLAFWKKKVDIERTVDAFKKVTSAEVLPATNKMVEAFTHTLNERVIAGKSRLQLVLGIVEQSLNDRIVRLREDHRILRDSDDATAKEKILNRLHSDIEVIDHRLQIIASHEGKFADVDAKAA